MKMTKEQPASECEELFGSEPCPICGGPIWDERPYCSNSCRNLEDNNILIEYCINQILKVNGEKGELIDKQCQLVEYLNSMFSTYAEKHLEGVIL